MVAMGDDKETMIWVGDQLHDLLGYNMPAIVSFVVGLGKCLLSSCFRSLK